MALSKSNAAVLVPLMSACISTAGGQTAARPIHTAKIPDAVRAEEIRDMKFGMFVCWSFSTFSGTEWTKTRDKGPDYFKATGCDTDQWCRTAKEAGMSYILFLTKHHDGFCLWDTATNEKKVTNSPLGIDVLAKLRESCDRHVIKLGLYYSEGDWNWPGAVDGKGGRTGGGSNPEVKKAQLEELCTQYGPIEFYWMDHATGTGGLDHDATAAWVHKFQPNCFVGFNHGPPAGRLCLRERGRPGALGDANASKYNKDAEARHKGYLVAEFTYPILPPHQGGAQWFYSLPKHDRLCSRPEKIYRDYVGAVRFGNIFSLNVGPNYEGKLREVDVDCLRKVGEMIREGVSLQEPLKIAETTASSVWPDHGYGPEKASDSDWNTRWGAAADARSGWLMLDLGEQVLVNRVLVAEQSFPRTQEYVIEYKDGDAWKALKTGMTLGGQTVCSFPARRMRHVRLRIFKASGVPTIEEFQVFTPPTKELTVEQKQKVDQYILDYIGELRVAEPQPQPPAVALFNERYADMCRKRAEAELAEHGRWFYCEDKEEFGSTRRWDEVVTYRTYWQLHARYGSLQKIPNYSKENHEAAIAFWQKWQKEDGTFFNALTGRTDDRGCNRKYVDIILRLLEAEPLYDTTGYGGAAPDIDQCLGLLAERKMNHGTATVSVMLNAIASGQTEYIPFVERAVELCAAQISPHTGMFHGPDGKGGGWDGYGATAETMKGMLRLIGYMGVENMPYRHVRADTLIEHQEQMRGSDISVRRNTAEMMVQCLLESPYRHEELLQALDGHGRSILDGDPSQSHISGDYAAYALMIFGPYLNWEGYEGRAPRTPWTMGAQYDYRVEVGPFGRCANVIRKRPEERLWHEDWTYAQYGLRARNTAHEKREVIDIVPVSSHGWAEETDETGRHTATRIFTLGAAKLQNPYLKMKWQGDVEIFINDEFVCRKLTGLADYGAVHIPEEARKTLKPGDNTLMVRTVEKADALDVYAGFIDWR